MRHDRRDIVIRRAIRERVCTICTQRPPGSEKLSHDQPRSCEGMCTIFLNLHGLSRIARQVDSEKSDENQVQNCVCQKCQVAASAGDYCADRLVRGCPLSRYYSDVIGLIRAINHGDEVLRQKRTAARQSAAAKPGSAGK